MYRMYQGRARRKAARAGALMAIMALLLPGGTDEGLGGRFRWGQRVLRAWLHVRYLTRRCTQCRHTVITDLVRYRKAYVDHEMIVAEFATTRRYVRQVVAHQLVCPDSTVTLV